MLHRVCDVARQKRCGQNVTLYLQDVCPPGAVGPLCLVSVCASSRRPDVRGLCVEALCNRPGIFRVRAEVVVTLDVTFRDARGCLFDAHELLVLPQDALLRLPERQQHCFEAAAHVRLCSDCYAGDLTFRVVLDTDVALYVTVIEPLRGGRTCPPHCTCPRCRCDSYFRLPLYPEG